MALRGQAPKDVAKRLKMFVFGLSGVGKTTAAISFPQAYVMDGEEGTTNYREEMEAAGSLVYPPTDFRDLLKEVRTLMSERHHYRTLVIDPITTFWNDLVEYWEKEVGSAHGRCFGKANNDMSRLCNLLKSIDMNVIVTSHARKEVVGGTGGDKDNVIGLTFDAWKGMDYLFDLVIELGRDKTFTAKQTREKVRYARVVKTRIKSFPEGDVFTWSYESFRQRYDPTVLERESATAPVASPEQVKRMVELQKLVKLGDAPTRWLSAAKVDRWEDMPGYAIQKCIEHVEGKLPTPSGNQPSTPAANGNGHSPTPSKPANTHEIDPDEEAERDAIRAEAAGLTPSRN